MNRRSRILESAEERDARRKAQRRASYKAYYERHKEEQRARMREAYDPEQKREYYVENRTAICERARAYYYKKKCTHNEERLATIIELTEEDPGLADVIKALDPASLSNREIVLLENIVFSKTMMQMDSQ